MTAPNYPPTPTQFPSVDAALKHAHKHLNVYGVHLAPGNVRTKIRKAFEATGSVGVHALLAEWVADQEPWVAIPLQYTDHTGNTAARHIDAEKRRALASTRAQPAQNETRDNEKDQHDHSNR